MVGPPPMPEPPRGLPPAPDPPLHPTIAAAARLPITTAQVLAFISRLHFALMSASSHHNVRRRESQFGLTPSPSAGYVQVRSSRDRGGTGRRAGLRILWGNPWGFDSLRSHLASLRVQHLPHLPGQALRRKGFLPIMEARLEHAMPDNRVVSVS